MTDTLLAVVLGVVEGLTEFLPVSSTAHIRLAQAICAGEASLEDPFWKLFAVLVQLPAIIAVVFYFWRTLWKLTVSFFERDMGFRDYFKHPVTLIAIATVVTGGPAFVLKHAIKDNLSNLFVIGSALLIGGIAMAVVDSYYGKRERRLISDAEAATAADQPVEPVAPGTYHPLFAPPRPNIPLTMNLQEMKPWQAAWIGLVQILSAVFPGTSRSMSTIAAGQIAGLTRAAALEFSFFVSIPLMFAACLSDLKNSLTPPTPDKASPDYIGRALNSHDFLVLGVGSVISFLVALVVIAWFMTYVRRHGFVPFAVYRVIIGTAVLVYAFRQAHGG